MINIKSFLSILLIINKKKSIAYEMVLSKVKGIDFFDRYDTLYNYLDHLLEPGAEEISKKDQSFLEDLSEVFKI